MKGDRAVECPPPVFLLGSHKSGSSLLRSLLDGHPQLAVLPKETHLFQFTNHWVDYRRRRNLPRPLNREQWLASMLRQIHEDTTGDEPYADAPDFAGYRMDILEQRLRALDTGNKPAFFMGYMQAAYEAAVGTRPAAGLSIVEKSVEHAEFAYVLARYFPGARFIHIVRNPYATLVAVRRMGEKQAGRYPFLGTMAASLRNSYYHLFTNQLALPDYLCLRFEDLVATPEAVMEKVARFLDIDFRPQLLHPTSMGRPWQGNSTSNQAFEGISSKPLEAWKSQVNDFEIALANAFAEPVFAEYGYERLPSRHPWRRARAERPKTYLANRAALSVGF